MYPSISLYIYKESTSIPSRRPLLGLCLTRLWLGPKGGLEPQWLNSSGKRKGGKDNGITSHGT